MENHMILLKLRHTIYDQTSRSVKMHLCSKNTLGKPHDHVTECVGIGEHPEDSVLSCRRRLGQSSDVSLLRSQGLTLTHSSSLPFLHYQHSPFTTCSFTKPSNLHQNFITSHLNPSTTVNMVVKWDDPNVQKNLLVAVVASIGANVTIDLVHLGPPGLLIVHVVQAR